MSRRMTEKARSAEHDGDNVYLYIRYDDRVDVFKFTKFEIVAAESADQLLSAAQPSYRLVGGKCNCDGFTYRNSCRHSKRLEYLSTTTLRGWQGCRRVS